MASYSDVNVSDIGAKRYLFCFFNNIDLNNVLIGYPSTFNVICWCGVKLRRRWILCMFLYFQADFWVQVHDLKIGYMSEQMAIC